MPSPVDNSINMNNPTTPVQPDNEEAVVWKHRKEEQEPEQDWTRNLRSNQTVDGGVIRVIPLL
jgi:hypothetical protein